MSKARDLADGTFDTDTLVVDAANNRVGIGTASPTAPLTVSGANPNIDVSDTGTSHASQDFLSNSSAVRATIGVEQSAGGGLFVGSSGYAAVFGTASAGSTQFATNNNIRMTLDTSGNVLVGTSSGSARINSYYAGGTTYSAKINASGSGMEVSSEGLSNTMTALSFRTNYGAVGSITCGSSTAYNTSSDYRLKENVTDLTGASDRVNQIPVHRFNFIADPDRTVDGFLAHEVADIVPEAITGEHNEVDEDGNPVYQSIDQSKLVPLLTAALQEALSEISDLKTRVAALETP